MGKASNKAGNGNGSSAAEIFSCRIFAPLINPIKALKGSVFLNCSSGTKQSHTGGLVLGMCERIKNGGEAGKDDVLLKLETTKVPDFAEHSPFSENTCRTQCLQNCSCIAYAFDSGIGCMSWSGNLIDIQRLTERGADLCIKVANSEHDEKGSVTVIITVTIVVGTIIAATLYLPWTWTFKHTAGRKHTEPHIQRTNADAKHVKLEEMPLYDFRKVASATNNFHSDNLLGRGGFGSVYKDGQKIAMKRLSRASGQGIEEFMNEMVVISKLQHRNLGKLHLFRRNICCVHRTFKKIKD
ncbi:hypothetical protein L6164_036521 [Bauhinia variegata]|uniref:Uncharacterized protein n=1 Tax=Bauhinia variegata TaxID=167791 RepID=A0ACB9KHF4_BAUVA|nr:hypothetical protein L6164_036521 [Bauhinia variegata]